MIDKRAENLKDTPNMSEEVLNFLKSVIKKSDRILEFGSGGSTIWFARHAKSVLSFESQSNWYRAVVKRLGELNLQNVELRYEPDYVFKGCPDLEKTFDFILVDTQAWLGIKRIESRLICAKTSHKYLKKGGWFLLDDTSTKICIAAVKYMKGINFNIHPIPGTINAIAWRKT